MAPTPPRPTPPAPAPAPATNKRIRQMHMPTLIRVNDTTLRVDISPSAASVQATPSPASSSSSNHATSSASASPRPRPTRTRTNGRPTRTSQGQGQTQQKEQKQQRQQQGQKQEQEQGEAPTQEQLQQQAEEQEKLKEESQCPSLYAHGNTSIDSTRSTVAEPHQTPFPVVDWGRVNTFVRQLRLERQAEARNSGHMTPARTPSPAPVIQHTMHTVINPTIKTEPSSETFGLGVGSQTHTENSTSKSTTMTTAATKSVTIAVSTIPTTTAGHKRSLAETLGFTDPEPKQEPLDEHNFNHTPEDTVYDDGDVLMGGAVEHGTSGKRPAMTEQKSNCTGTGSELVDSSMDIDIVEPFAAALAATDIIGQQTNIPSCTPSPLRSSKRSALENHQTIASSRSQSPLITARRSSERTTPLRTTPSRTAAIETQSSSIHVRKSVDPQQERTTSPTELIDTPLEEQSLEDILSPDLMIQPIPRFSGRRPVYKALVYRLDPTLKTVKEVLLEYMVGSPMAKPYTIPSPFVAEPDTRYPAVKDLLVKYEYEWVHKDDRDLLQSRLGVVKMYLVLTEIDELSVKEAIQELEEQQDDRHLIPFGHALAREARARYLAGTAKNLSYCEEEYVPDVEPRRGSAKDFYRGSPRPEEGEIWFSDYGAKGEFTKYGPLRHPTKIFLPDLTITDVEKIWVEWHQGLTHAQGRDRAYWALPGSSKQHYQEFCLRKKIVQSISDGVCTRKVAQIRYAFIELRDLQRGSHNKLVGFADPSDFRTAVFAHKNATVSEIQTKIRVAIAVLLLKQQEEEKENAGLTVQEKEQKEKNTRVRNLQHVKALIQGNIRDRVEASRQRLEASKGKDVVQAA